MGEHFPTPWRMDPQSFSIYAQDVPKGPARVADMRGWGYLTGKGHGALALPEALAVETQKANAEFIVTAVNNHHPMRDALLRLEQACEQLAATRSLAVYTAMIDGGQTQALLELDNARRCAREALAGDVGNAGSGS